MVERARAQATTSNPIHDLHSQVVKPGKRPNAPPRRTPTPSTEGRIAQRPRPPLSVQAHSFQSPVHTTTRCRLPAALLCCALAEGGHLSLLHSSLATFPGCPALHPTPTATTSSVPTAHLPVFPRPLSPPKTQPRMLLLTAEQDGETLGPREEGALRVSWHALPNDAMAGILQEGAVRDGSARHGCCEYGCSHGAHSILAVTSQAQAEPPRARERQERQGRVGSVHFCPANKRRGTPTFPGVSRE